MKVRSLLAMFILALAASVSTFAHGVRPESKWAKLDGNKIHYYDVVSSSPKSKDGASFGSLPSRQNYNDNPLIIENLNLLINADVDAEGIFVKGIETDTGRRALVKNVNIKKRSGDIK